MEKTTEKTKDCCSANAAVCSCGDGCLCAANAAVGDNCKCTDCSCNKIKSNSKCKKLNNCCCCMP